MSTTIVVVQQDIPTVVANYSPEVLTSIKPAINTVVVNSDEV